MKLDHSDSVYDRWDSDVVALVAFVAVGMLAIIALAILMPKPDIVWTIAFLVGAATGITPYLVYTEWEDRRWMNRWDR